MISGISGMMNSTNLYGITSNQRPPKPEEMFSAIDTNSDGSIDKTEFEAFDAEMSEKTGRPGKAEEMFSMIDTDGDGKITREEDTAFHSQMKDRMDLAGLMRPPDQEDMFSKIDTNADGSVDKAEFKTFVEQMNQESGRTGNAEEMFSKIDTDGDEKISSEEDETFRANMKQKRAGGPPPQGPGGSGGGSSESDLLSQLLGNSDSTEDSEDVNGDGVVNYLDTIAKLTSALESYKSSSDLASQSSFLSSGSLNTEA